MMNLRIGRWATIATFLLTACGPATITADTSDPTAVTTDTPSAVVPRETRQPSRQNLTLWIPPTFSPGAPSPAGALLADRLEEFKATHPQVDLVVRTKAASGTAGLLDTLAAASVAAPAALPDVIAIDPTGLRTAAIKGLIVPLNGLVTEPGSPEWYEHALSSSQVDGKLFGLPFASEAEVLSYDVVRYPRPPLSWAEVLAGPAPFVFPAADPTAVFTLAQYVSLGGALTDDGGRPWLDEQALTEVLTFYSSARAAGVIPLSTRQFVTDGDTWAAVRGVRAAAGTAPLSAFLAQYDPAAHAALPLPTKAGGGVCFAQTWSWAIVSEDADVQALSAELIAWLEEPSFLGSWTRALGMLPPNKSALDQWPSGPQRSMVTRLASLATSMPPEEVLVTYGPPLQTAVESVISGGSTAAQAARAAAQAVTIP